MTELNTVNVLLELERCGIKFDWSTQDEIKIKCPFHADTSPSCHVNIQKRVFNCKAADCNAHGDFVTLLARILITNRATILADLAKRYVLDNSKLIDSALVERYHTQIWQALPLLQELYNRGLTNEDIRYYRLGEHEGRITIPIKNEAGLFVNVRKYLPGAPGKDKMRNVRGHGQMRLFPIEQLKYDKILYCGGECKAIVAARQLNPHGVGAICATTGEGNLDVDLVLQFRSKAIGVCLDIDSAGIVAAKQRCLEFKRVAEWVSEPILLPLNVDQYPKGDINDFVAPPINGELLPLWESAKEFTAETVAQVFDDTTPPEAMELVQAIHANSTAKRIAVKAVITAMDTSPYIVPKNVTIVCTRDQKECALCTVGQTGISNFTIPPESPSILELVGTDKDHQLQPVKDAVGIPRTCRVCDFIPSSYYNVEDTRVSPQLDITDRGSDRIIQQAYCINGSGLELNGSFNLIGRMFPSPKTQQSTLLISHYDTTQDSLSSFKLDSPETLTIFWPQEWSIEGMQEKLNDIYADLEANVTRIFMRQDLHIVVDLMYHSPLFINFDGKSRKGWVEALVVGDSSNGKSEVSCGADGNGGLMTHYGLGQRVDMRNATVAGILGGLQQFGARWFASWGIMPNNDKRAVIMEELKGASTEVIGRITDMRSSGKAQLAKIEKYITWARTRLLATSNARSEMKVSQYNYGVEIIKELVGALEDIRRFDIALIVASSEVPIEIINQLQKHRPQVEHYYLSDHCRNLVLWAWTRTANQIEFTQEATDLILNESARLCAMFTDDIPLIDRGSMRLKLARLSASIAARLFSCSEDYDRLIIYPCHVQYIANFLERVYSSPVFGYLQYTQALQVSQGLINPELIKAEISATPYPSDLIKQLIAKNRIDLQDVADWCSWDKEQATNLLSIFVRKHCMLRDGGGYRKTSEFISLLKDMLERGDYYDKPPHLRKDF